MKSLGKWELSLDKIHTCIFIIKISSQIRPMISVVFADELALTHHSWNLEKDALFISSECVEKDQKCKKEKTHHQPHLPLAN